MEAMGPALLSGFGSRYEPTDSSNPREVNWEMGAGGWVNGYIGDGQAANRTCTAHTHTTEHGFEPRSRLACHGAVAFVILGCKSIRPMGGVGL